MERNGKGVYEMDKGREKRVHDNDTKDIVVH
jgi:hypothetical protein